MSSVRECSNCRICGAHLPEPFLELGPQPPANNLLRNPNEEEGHFPLGVVRCGGCSLVQLTHVVDPSLLYRDYLYVPSVSTAMRDHFNGLAQTVHEYCRSDSLAVDVGSNDAFMLRLLKERGTRVVGVDPAENLAPEAEASGVPTVCDFFGLRAAKSILSSYGTADVITATNVFAHVDNIEEFLQGVVTLLKREGVFIVEVPYLGAMLEQGTFDMIYHEHLSYFALSPLRQFFSRHDMEVVRVEHITTHGGSIRVFAQFLSHQGSKETRVEELSQKEQSWLFHEESFNTFARRVGLIKHTFSSLISDRIAQGKRIAGYGLPAKASTLLNFCGISSDDMAYIVDDSPAKQGKWAPGSRIPIVAATRLHDDPVDCIVIFPWNLVKEITERLNPHLSRGVEILTPIQDIADEWHGLDQHSSQGPKR